MSYGLSTVDEALQRLYREHIAMKKALEKKLVHPSGGIRTKKQSGKQKMFYVYTQNHKQHARSIPDDQIESMQQYVQNLKDCEEALLEVCRQLKKIHRCMKLLKVEPDLGTDTIRKPVQSGDTVPHPEHLRHRTLRGEYVRSKSEALLANILFFHNISYEYEKPLHLSGHLLYPDFTISLPDGSVLYWEHLGMLNDAEYSRSWAKKNNVYMKNGLSEGNGLIITRDRNGVFDAEDVQRKIQDYHLSPKTL